VDWNHPLNKGKFQKLLFCPMAALFVGWQIALQFSKPCVLLQGAGQMLTYREYAALFSLLTPCHQTKFLISGTSLKID